MVEDKIDGLKLISRVSASQILSEILFDENELALLPLVYLQLAKERKEQRPIEKCKYSWKKLDKDVVPLNVTNQDSKKENKPDLTPEQAYQNLVATDVSDNTLKQYIKEYILKHLPDKLKDSAPGKSTKVQDNQVGVISKLSEQTQKEMKRINSDSNDKYMNHRKENAKRFGTQKPTVIRRMKKSFMKFQND